MRIILGWPLKRSVFARLTAISDGSRSPYPGSELLVADGESWPVQVATALPAEPDRVCIFGGPLSGSRREITGESAQGQGLAQAVAVGEAEQIRLEIRVRVYQPGEDFDDVDRQLGDVMSAVHTAVTAEPFFDQGRIYLSGYSQDPTAIRGAPEPSVIGNAVLVYLAEVIGF